MRNLYLVRHGKVDFPGGVKRCIGRTDISLDGEGRRQAQALGEYFQKKEELRVFSSPLSRARETAALLAGDRFPICQEEGLTELYMGEWENVPMQELKKTLEAEPLTGEGRARGLARFQSAVRRILASTESDVVCVAHAGINCCFLASLLKIPLETSRALPQPYGCFSRIEVDEDGKMQVAELGRMTKTAPDEEECSRIYQRFDTPEKVQSHCRQVCQVALSLGEQLKNAGWPVDLELIRGAALLHDAAKLKAHHAGEIAALLVHEGYPQAAGIVRQHHDLEPAPQYPYETIAVYLADKLVCGDKVVSLQERFERSREKCRRAENPEEALKTHERRYREALAAKARLDEWLGLRSNGPTRLGVKA